MMDFTSALDTSVADFEPPKNVPMGTYIMAITKAHTVKTVGKNEDWERLSFPAKIISAEEVDEDDLEEFGSVANEPMQIVFMFPKDEEQKQSWDRTMDQLKRFLFKHLQVDVDESASLGEALAAAVNCQFLGTIGHRPDPNDAERVFAEVNRTAPLD